MGRNHCRNISYDWGVFNLNFIEEAESIITDGKMQLVDCYGDTLAFITKDTPLFCVEHWIGAHFYGANLNALVNDKIVLLETYDETDETLGRELANNVIENIKNGFTAGVTYYVIASN